MKCDLEGKTVALTGGSRGIGRHVALALAREGARLAVMARTPSQSPEVCARAIVRAIKKGKQEADTAWLPKLSGVLFKLHAPWGDWINRLFLPKAYH